MITCVSVYLASGTISTLEHSERSEHAIWKVWDAASSFGMGAGYSTVSPSLPTVPGSSNYSRSHLLFPKSIKGESSSTSSLLLAGVSASVGSRGRGDGRTWTNNTSFLLQKARVLRREAEIDPDAIANNDTMFAADEAETMAMASSAGAVGSLENANSTEDTLDIVTYAADGYPSGNQSNKAACEVMGVDGGGSSLLYVRFQVNSGTSFTVCRQLWWHYVNMAGENQFCAQ